LREKCFLKPTRKREGGPSGKRRSQILSRPLRKEIPPVPTKLRERKRRRLLLGKERVIEEKDLHKRVAIIGLGEKGERGQGTPANVAEGRSRKKKESVFLFSKKKKVLKSAPGTKEKEIPLGEKKRGVSFPENEKTGSKKQKHGGLEGGRGGFNSILNPKKMEKGECGRGPE